jgi:hypothetical protein
MSRRTFLPHSGAIAMSIHSVLAAVVLVVASSALAQPVPQTMQPALTVQQNHPIATASQGGTKLPPGAAYLLVQAVSPKATIIEHSDQCCGNKIDTQVDGITVQCPAQLVISAQASIGIAGPALFESYLLAPDGSKQTWVKGAQIDARPPLPYRVPTHGEYKLATTSFDQTLTLVMNVTINGKTTHMEVPQHFSVVCQGFKP